jgi:hypothetical protein
MSSIGATLFNNAYNITSDIINNNYNIYNDYYNIISSINHIYITNIYTIDEPSLSEEQVQSMITYFNQFK